MDVELLRKLSQCSVALDSGKRQLRLESRRVVPARSSCHGLSPDSLGTACPPSGRNSTYRPVQISETSSVDRQGYPGAEKHDWKLLLDGEGYAEQRYRITLLPELGKLIWVNNRTATTEHQLSNETAISSLPSIQITRTPKLFARSCSGAKRSEECHVCGIAART
jgi:hypothetical protein